MTRVRLWKNGVLVADNTIEDPMTPEAVVEFYKLMLGTEFWAVADELEVVTVTA